MLEGRSKKVLPILAVNRSPKASIAKKGASFEATVKDKPLNPKIGKFTLKFTLGSLLFLFLLNYQPVLGFPPVKQRVANAQEQSTQSQQITPSQLPIQFQLPHPGYITTHFSSYHPGVDLCTGLGMPIKPVAKGTVVEAGFNIWGLGLVVEVEHEAGYRSLYAHMGKIYVQKGQNVDVNDYLGVVGMTGHTSGPHTHLEFTKDGKKIDPLALLPEIRDYSEQQDFLTYNSSTPSTVETPQQTPVTSQSTGLNPSLNLSQNVLTAPAPSPSQDPIRSIIETTIPQVQKTPKPLAQGGSFQLSVKNLLGIR